MLEFIKQIAVEAGKIIKKAYDTRIEKIEHKGDIDLVTEIDLKSEQLLKQRIQEKYPVDAILAEEGKEVNAGATRRWIIDPLDGTTNFTHRFPFLAVSIGVEEAGKMKYGVVYNPVMKEMFWTQCGNGAFLNGKPISVSATNRLSQALVGTGFPYDRWQHGDFYIKEYQIFMQNTQGVRRGGAAAVDLCYVGCGRLDGFFERKLHPWDMAAGSLILKEAGGKLSQFSGEKWHYTNDTIVASNTNLHQAMLKLLAKANL
ncbi:MAG: inositol monophosphatase family protein [Candidatus Cloacimonadota bacterium]|nr:inositol monophosphatase family protein [Candidatus Cloacimonadota bacterium]